MALTYYDILEVSQDATPAQIKASYYSLIRFYHPDANQGPKEKRAKEKTQAIVNAYEILKDPEQRRLYDVKIAPGQRRPGAQNASNSANSRNPNHAESASQPEEKPAPHPPHTASANNQKAQKASPETSTETDPHDTSTEREEGFYESKPIIPVGVLIKCGAGLAGFFLFLLIFFNVIANINAHQTILVPNLLANTKETAEAVLNEKGLRLHVEEETYQTDTPQGNIYQTQPEAGSHVPVGSTIKVWVSKGLQPPQTVSTSSTLVKIPDVMGKPLAEACEMLEEIKLTYEISPERTADDVIPEDSVLRVEPPVGKEISENTMVTLYLSAGTTSKVNRDSDTSGKFFKDDKFFKKAEPPQPAWARDWIKDGWLTIGYERDRHDLDSVAETYQMKATEIKYGGGKDTDTPEWTVVGKYKDADADEGQFSLEIFHDGRVKGLIGLNKSSLQDQLEGRLSETNIIVKRSSPYRDFGTLTIPLTMHPKQKNRASISSTQPYAKMIKEFWDADKSQSEELTAKLTAMGSAGGGNSSRNSQTLATARRAFREFAEIRQKAFDDIKNITPPIALNTWHERMCQYYERSIDAVDRLANSLFQNDRSSFESLLKQGQEIEEEWKVTSADLLRSAGYDAERFQSDYSLIKVK